MQTLLMVILVVGSVCAMSGCADVAQDNDLSAGYCFEYGDGTGARPAGSVGRPGPDILPDGSFQTCPLVQFEPDPDTRMVTVVAASEGHTWSELSVTGCASLEGNRIIRPGDDLVNCHGWVWISHAETDFRILQAHFPIW